MAHGIAKAIVERKPERVGLGGEGACGGNGKEEREYPFHGVLLSIVQLGFLNQ